MLLSRNSLVILDGLQKIEMNMCRRSVGLVERALIYLISYVMLLSGAAETVQAQELPVSVTTRIEQLAEEGVAADELVRYYEGLLLSPLNLNAASREKLEETGLLTLFQVESVLAWRERYGAVRSFTEWALVEGF